MLTLNVNGKKGVFNLNLPTSIDEITWSYIQSVTDNIKIAPNYSLIGVVFREKLSTLVIAARNNKRNSDIPVIPIFIKAGSTNDVLINNLNGREKLIIGASDIMMGNHISTPRNLLTINTILELIEGDSETYHTLVKHSESCYFIEFKLVPNCNIHGAYDKEHKTNFVNPFVIKVAEAKDSNIILPNTPELIV